MAADDTTPTPKAFRRSEENPLDLTCLAVLRHPGSVPDGVHGDQGDGVDGVGLEVPQHGAGGRPGDLVLFTPAGELGFSVCWLPGRKRF